MRNLLLLSLLFVSLFSFAQNNGTGTSIEVTEFTSDGIEYRHVQGSLYPGDNCFVNVEVTSQNTLSLADNGETGADLILTLNVGSEGYQILPSENNARIQEWGRFSGSNRTSLMSDNSDVEENLLGCPSWVETDAIRFIYTNTQYPENSIRILRNSSNWIVRVYHNENQVHQVVLSRPEHTEAEALQAGADYVADNY